MDYYSLLSAIKMNVDIHDRLHENVSVYIQNSGLKVLKIWDKICPKAKYVLYQLSEKKLKIKITIVETPKPYDFFVFGELIKEYNP